MAHTIWIAFSMALNFELVIVGLIRVRDANISLYASSARFSITWKCSLQCDLKVFIVDLDSSWMRYAVNSA